MAKSFWFCPLCDNALTLYVNASATPTCANNHKTQDMIYSKKDKAPKQPKETT